MIKDRNEQPSEEVHRARSRWILSTGTPVPFEFGMWYPPSTWMHSPTWKLSKVLLLRVFMEVSLHMHDWSNHWPSVINSISSPFPLTVSQTVGLKAPSLQSHGLSSVHQPPFSNIPLLVLTQLWLKGVCYEKQKMLLSPLSLRNLQAF